MKRSDLPDECWEMIFNFLGHHRNLEPLSLVSKSFFSISNRIRTHLTMAEPTFLSHGTVSPFLARFRNLTSISLVHFRGDLNETLLQIAASDLKIETLDISRNASFPTDGLAPLGKNIKVFICSGVKLVGDPQLAFIADSFPLLEELDISYLIHPETRDGSVMITDNGIEYFASRLTKKLRKIDVSGNTCIGDKSIFTIFSNCFHLSEIKFLHCHRVTHDVFQFLAKKSSMDYTQIIPLAFPGNQLHRVLSSLHICSASIPDEFLINIANARFPLKKLTLQIYDDDSSINNFTFSGLSMLLKTYPSLDYLALDSLDFLEDSLVAVLSAYFQSLIEIKLLDCLDLSFSSLFLLIKNCPFLEDIEMQIYKGQTNSILDPVENPRIKSLNLGSSMGLDDECLITLSSVCTKLERLDVSACPCITNVGVERILSKCTEISNLDISYCENITSIGTGEILKNLKFIKVDGLEIDTIGLIMIGTRFTELERLSMMRCKCKKILSDDAFSEIIRYCKRLKYIHLDGTNIPREIFDLVVISMPSLMMVGPPSGSSFIFVSSRRCP